MDRQDAEMYITEYLEPIYRFAVKRCACLQEAEDLASEIVYRAYKAILFRDDIEEVGKYIWTVAHHTLCNYYRAHQKSGIGISIEEMTEYLPDNRTNVPDDVILRETVEKLQREIAYLSRTQREIIIAHYYENKKLNEIARQLSLPIGTVKSHLFEARKNLKRGMEKMRTTSELKFNPVHFDFCSTSGKAGTNGSNSQLLRSVLSQNIIYAVRKEAKAVDGAGNII